LGGARAYWSEFDWLICNRTILRIGYLNDEGVGQQAASYAGLAIAADDFDVTRQAFGGDSDIAPAAERHGEHKKEEQP
jgi:hypothetical protein